MAQRHLDYNSAYSESDRYLKTFLHNRHPAAMSPPPKQTRTSPVERGAQSAIPTSAQGQPTVCRHTLCFCVGFTLLTFEKHFARILPCYVISPSGSFIVSAPLSMDVSRNEYGEVLLRSTFLGNSSTSISMEPTACALSACRYFIKECLDLSSSKRGSGLLLRHARARTLQTLRTASFRATLPITICARALGLTL